MITSTWITKIQDVKDVEMNDAFYLQKRVNLHHKRLILRSAIMLNIEMNIIVPDPIREDKSLRVMGGFSYSTG